MQVNFLCKCGHVFGVHKLIDGGYTVCQKCWDSDRSVICYEYFPDNLKFIEMVYEESNK